MKIIETDGIVLKTMDFKEKDSIKIKIDAKVMGDLNEFITQ